MEPLKLLICIVERSKAKRITELCHREKLPGHVLLRGRGTADSAMLGCLGIGETERAVALICVRSSRAKAVLSILSDVMKLESPGGGIAFTVPMKSIMDSRVYDILAGAEKEASDEV